MAPRRGIAFEQLDGDTTELRDQIELGVTLGVDRPFKLWLLKIQRLGIGYRYGGELSSVRILFSATF